MFATLAGRLQLLQVDDVLRVALLAWSGSLDLRTAVVFGISKSHCTDGRVRHIGRSFIRMRNKPGTRIERKRERERVL